MYSIVLTPSLTNYGNLHESDVGFGEGVDSSVCVDSFEGIESLGGWRNWSNVSPEGSLNFRPDSRKCVREFSGCISIAPIFAQAVLDKGIVEFCGRLA